MANERFIRGKADDARHAGLYSNTKRLQEAQAHVAEFLRGDYDDLGPKLPVVRMTRSVIKLTTK